MIVKKIKNKQDNPKPKAWQIGDLVDYIRHPHDINPEEKIEYSGSRNFLSDTHTGQKIEMIALARESVHSKMPVQHWIFSWQEGEQPTAEQVEKMVDTFLQRMGLEGHQVIFGLHNNTQNYHLHIAVNRMHPEELKVIVPHKGFDIEAAHKIVARIESEQGWHCEKNARYVLLENGEVVRKQRKKKQIKPTQAAQDFECATGEKSAQRIAQERGYEIMKRAQNWQELHEQLATQGILYKQKGSGAIVVVGDIEIKASSVGRDCSIKNMIKRLGDYEAPQEKTNDRFYAHTRSKSYPFPLQRLAANRLRRLSQCRLAPRDTTQTGGIEGVLPPDARSGRRQPEFVRRYRHRPEPVSVVNRAEWDAYSAQLTAYREQQGAFRTRLLSLKTTHALEQKTLAETQAVERTELRSGNWKGKGVIVCALRHLMAREHRQARLEMKQRQKNEMQTEKQLFRDQFSVFPRFEDWLRACGEDTKAEQWRYRKDAEEELTMPEPVSVHSKDTQHLTSQHDAFMAYHEAVAAERYRVTCIRMSPDGSKKTFILDKQGGETRGFTPEELVQRLPEMLRLQQRGENIYYTPLSSQKHHILIDDMDKTKLEALIKDGFQPAALLESSPGNFQAVLTIPKLETEYDRDVGNRITERLNKQYGDSKLSGCIHPHRAPGFENRKPKHQKSDGSFPKVTLLRSKKRECAKALAVSKEIHAEYVALAVEQKAHKLHLPESRLTTTPGSPVDAYYRHLDNIKQHIAITDSSRVDSMIALRMRATGHAQDAIAEAIRQCAPTWREEETRDWERYAGRTVAYAFGLAGDRDLRQNEGYVRLWLKIEGRSEGRKRMR